MTRIICLAVGVALFTLAAACLIVYAEIDCLVPPENQTTKTYDYGCGTYDWDMVAAYGGNVYDEGTATSYGTCTGNYWNCQCTYVSPSYRASYIEPDFVQDPGGTSCDASYTISWTTTNLYSPQYSACDNGPSCSNTMEVETDNTYTSPGWGHDDIYCSSCFAPQ